MRLGIDIDNVISKFDEKMLEKYLEHDKELRGNGIVNKDAKYIRKGMFDWTEEEEKDFYYSNIESIAKDLAVVDGAKEYIDKLRLEGHEIYIITGRDNGEYKDPINMTKEWLDKKKINYDKIIFTNAAKHDKYVTCFENHIDVMIDDSKKICEKCIENGMPSLLMTTDYNKDNTLKRVSSWREIYDFVNDNKKIHVILDTDTYNECDDQYALSYLIKSSDRFILDAITIAPFSHVSRNVKVPESQELSYNEALKICNFLGYNTDDKVFKGSMDYLINGYRDVTPAVTKIIQTALNNDKTYIVAIGAITNIALAILKEPKIVEKIEVVWLGGNGLACEDNYEYNFRQDVEAAKAVFNSKVKLTLLPCKNVVSALEITIDELKENLEANELNNYLMDRFYNDGYHGIQTKRVIWDISCVAYLINRKWFETKEISLPIIRDDTSYQMTDTDDTINIVVNVDRDKIYNDLFNKLGRK